MENNTADAEQMFDRASNAADLAFNLALKREAEGNQVSADEWLDAAIAHETDAASWRSGDWTPDWPCPQVRPTGGD